ncbi:MAG: archaemetzincin family Zn-dependent metalloprotease [Deltaproteobacteria bacterium]|nr:archaemetzincin family Zn-dependent metalloprotease [Deltaproteobacteria bacterium]
MANRETIAIVPYGAVTPAVIGAARATVAATFGCGGVELPARTIPAEAVDPTRRQCSSRVLLADLLTCVPSDARCALGVTAADLFLPPLTFVFGEAQLAGRAAVVSTCRLREESYLRPPDLSLFDARLRKEIVHELGHAFGLVHCDDRDCVMWQSATLGDTDAKGAELCFSCRASLRSHGPG